MMSLWPRLPCDDRAITRSPDPAVAASNTPIGGVVVRSGIAAVVGKAEVAALGSGADVAPAVGMADCMTLAGATVVG